MRSDIMIATMREEEGHSKVQNYGFESMSQWKNPEVWGQSWDKNSVEVHVYER